jgi:hypothetical protein
MWTAPVPRAQDFSFGRRYIKSLVIHPVVYIIHLRQRLIE